MRTPLLSSLLLVGLVVLSGCSGFPGFDSGEAQETTEASTLSDELQSNSPPGVRDGRLVNPEQLLNQHWAILSYRAYAAQRHYVERQNRSLSARTNVTIKHASDGQYRATVVSTQGLADRTEYWFDGERGYLASTIGNETRYTRARTARGSTPLPEDLLYFATPPYRSGLVNQRGLYQYLTAAQGSTLETIQTEEGSDTLFGLTTQLSEPSAVGSSARFDSIRNGSFTAVVDPWGVVHSYQLTYEGVVGEQTVTVTETVSYELDTEITVTPPAWSEQVNNKSDQNEREHVVLSRAS